MLLALLLVLSVVGLATAVPHSTSQAVRLCPYRTSHSKGVDGHSLGQYRTPRSKRVCARPVPDTVHARRNQTHAVAFLVQTVRNLKEFLFEFAASTDLRHQNIFAVVLRRYEPAAAA
eukprot:3032923-Rhodomonas_salina.4